MASVLVLVLDQYLIVQKPYSIIVWSWSQFCALGEGTRTTHGGIHTLPAGWFYILETGCLLGTVHFRPWFVLSWYSLSPYRYYIAESEDISNGFHHFRPGITTLDISNGFHYFRPGITTLDISNGFHYFRPGMTTLGMRQFYGWITVYDIILLGTNLVWGYDAPWWDYHALEKAQIGS